jgi:hypothetical protein
MVLGKYLSLEEARKEDQLKMHGRAEYIFLFNHVPF